MKDVLIEVLSDNDIKQEVIGWTDVDDKTVEETVSFVEGKEMARNAMNNSSVAAPLSSYKKLDRPDSKNPPKEKAKIRCPSCNIETDKVVWNKRQNKHIEVTQCLTCWKKANLKKRSKDNTKNDKSTTENPDETSALLIGGISDSEPVTAVDIVPLCRIYGVNTPRNESTTSQQKQ